MKTPNDFSEDPTLARLVRENYLVADTPPGFSQRIMDAIELQALPANQRKTRIFNWSLILALIALLLLPWTWGYLSGLTGTLLQVFRLPVPDSFIPLLFIGLVSVPLLLWIDWLIGQNRPSPEQL